MVDLRPRTTTPPWLRWLVFAFLLYLGYMHFVGRAGDTANLDRSKDVIAPQQADIVEVMPTGISVRGDIAGHGEPASCGQQAAVDVTATKPDGTLGGSESRTLIVGMAGDRTPPWEPGLSGMRKGGVREIALSAREALGPDEAKKQGYESNGDQFRYKIELHDLSPALPDGSLPLRASEVATGQGNLVSCGDQVKIQLDIWKKDGTKLFTTRGKEDGALTVRVGDRALPYGIERGLVNQRVGSTRNLIVPPAYLVSQGSSLPALPKDELLIADVQLLEIIKPAAKAD